MGYSTNLITKSIKNSIILANKTNKNVKIAYTSRLNFRDLKSTHFFYSLVQENVPKKYEIRCFYYNKICYSMAIFSQSNKETEIDSRKIDFKNPNKFVPYQLPEEVEDKLHKLMLFLNLDSGSIDLIKTSDDKFVFLEVNPLGQFGMISKPCNYNLEKIVASHLIKN